MYDSKRHRKKKNMDNQNLKTDNQNEELNKNRYLKSMYFKGSNIDTIQIIVNNNIKYGKFIIDDNKNISLGGDSIFKSEGLIYIRIKVENLDGSDKIYKLYNKEDKSTTEIDTKMLHDYIIQKGFSLISENEYKLIRIPSL